MILKKIDYLSPQITFYHKGFLSHSSIISGIISIIAFLIIIIFAIYYSLDLINRENPKVFFFNRVVENSGAFPLSPSILFHFISLGNNEVVKEFDFYSFRIIGFDIYYSLYLDNRNLSKYNHWIYGICNDEIDNEEISHLIIKEDFEKSACIKKYYNSLDGKYYDKDNPNFKWPIIAYKNNSSEKKYYSIIIEKCEEETLELILGKGNKCKNDKNMENYFTGDWGTLLKFIDHYIDVLDFKDPNRKYFYNIENTLNKDNFSINHLNFNPSSIITNKGIFLDDIKNELSYIYERNDVFTEKNINNDIYMIYNFWMINRMQYYKRIYKTIQDVISDIGGISQFITVLASFINSLYNDYKIISDFDELISPLMSNNKDNKKLKNNTEFSDLKKSTQKDEINKLDNTQIEKNFNSNNEIIEKEKVLKHNSNINNYAYIKGNGYKDDSKIITDNSLQQFNIFKNEKKNFWGYLIQKIKCNKNNYFYIYNKLRTKIMSEEHIIKNHLDVYSLLEMSEINGFELEKQYKLKDLLNHG